jgi:hypothetical protein
LLSVNASEQKKIVQCLLIASKAYIAQNGNNMFPKKKKNKSHLLRLTSLAPQQEKFLQSLAIFKISPLAKFAFILAIDWRGCCEIR